MKPPSLTQSGPPLNEEGQLTYAAEELHFDMQGLERLAGKLGTPFFLVSEAALEANYRALERGLSANGARVCVRYCAKTNNEAGVLRTLAGLGSDVLVSHLAEAQLARQCGFPPERIAFQRPVLSADEARRILEAGITFFHAFRESDLDLLDRLAGEQQVPVRISLRLRNRSRLSSLSPLGMYAQRLGFPAEELVAAADRIQGSNRLTLEAVNFYRGTQIGNPKRYAGLLKAAARAAAEIEKRYGIPVREVNLGGGLPSPSLRKPGLGGLRARFSGPHPLGDTVEPLEAYARALSALFTDAFEGSGIPNAPRLAVEPGRSIVGNATLLVTRVQAVRGRWAFLDASKNYLPENSFLFTRPILPVRRAERPTAIQHLSGSTLNTLDVIDFGRRLARLQPGDLLALGDAGAYSISRSTSYAGTTPPVYLIRHGGEIEPIRRAGEAGDLAALMTGTGEPARPVR